MKSIRLSAHPTELKFEILIFDLIMNDVNNFRGFFHQLAAGHIRQFEFFHFCFCSLLGLANSAAIVAESQISCECLHCWENCFWTAFERRQEIIDPTRSKIRKALHSIACFLQFCYTFPSALLLRRALWPSTTCKHARKEPRDPSNSWWERDYHIHSFGRDKSNKLRKVHTSCDWWCRSFAQKET